MFWTKKAKEVKPIVKPIVKAIDLYKEMGIEELRQQCDLVTCFPEILAIERVNIGDPEGERTIISIPGEQGKLLAERFYCSRAQHNELVKSLK
jgi:hypothetical protein